MTDTLLRALLEAVLRFVPSGERERWSGEWRADLRDLRERGMGFGEALGWTAGLWTTAVRMRFEGVAMDGWGREIRHATRGLLRRPGFTTVAVVTLGLGIGANSAIFSVVNGVVLEPLPYPDSKELVSISSAFPTLGFETFWISPPEYLELQERGRSFEVVGAYRGRRVSVGGGGRPERVQGAIASAELFEALGVQPRLGRLYTRDEDVAGARPVALISRELWNRVFGGDPAILERSIDVDGTPMSVVGVMPPGFDLDDEGVEIWLPLALDPANPGGRGSHYLNLVARLNDGVSVSAASRELDGLVEAWEESSAGAGHVPTPDMHPMSLTPLHEEVVGEVRTALFVLLGAVGLVLLIACANVANLLLARAESRQREVAVRVAMGAGRVRLLRQFLTEGLVLSGLGALVGIGVAWGSLELLQARGPAELPRLQEVELDGVVVLFTVGVAALTGVVFGLAPTRYVKGGNVSGTLREGGTRATVGGGRLRLRSLLVVSEMALALILTLGAGLLIRSFSELTEVDPGFETADVSTFQLYLPSVSYPGPGPVLAFYDDLRARLEALPAARSTALMSGLPPIRDLAASDTEFEGLEPTPDGPPHNVDYFQTVHGPYLETMGIELLRGRGFEGSDGPESTPVALVNERLADVFYGGDALGRRLRPRWGSGPWFEIVGVVENVKQGGLDEPAGTEIYLLHEQYVQAYGGASRGMNVVVRSESPFGTLAPALRRTVAELDPQLPVAGLRTMERVVSDARARPRFLTVLLGAFAAAALVLAAVGTYGVMSYAVAQRAREMGIRMALGAEPGRVRRLVLRHGVVVALLGLAVGVMGAWWLTGLLESLLFGVTARDAVTFAVVPVLLLGVALVASWIPAHRATRVDPVEVLRED